MAKMTLIHLQISFSEHYARPFIATPNGDIGYHFFILL